MNNNKQKGFTLIELIIVIIILGILAAFALPKYMALDKEARISVVKGLDGSIRAAVRLVHGLAVARGQDCTANINVLSETDGGVVTVTPRCYPTADNNGINAALSDISGFTGTPSGTVMTYTKNGATDPDDCSVVYNSASATNTSSVTTNC